jgi:hypothetical protein
LTTAERLLPRNPTALTFQRYRADALEALGHCYFRLGKRQEAREWWGKSRDIWKDWTARKVGAPYAARRLREVSAALAR